MHDAEVAPSKAQAFFCEAFFVPVGLRVPDSSFTDSSTLWRRADVMTPGRLNPGLQTLSTARPLGLLAKVEEHFAGFGHEQDSVVFTIGKVFEANGSRIAMTEINFAAGLFGDAS